MRKNNNDEIPVRDKYFKLKRTVNKTQAAKILVDFWCKKCCWREGKVPDCEEVCIEAVMEWLSEKEE